MIFAILSARLGPYLDVYGEGGSLANSASEHRL
jgi:hypothetical protein